MKGFITIGLLTCLLALTAFADESTTAPNQMIRIGVDLDYTTVNMGQVNKLLNKGDSIANLSFGFTGMLDLYIIFSPLLMIGARSGYVYCLPASASYNYVLYKETTTINASLIPLEAGVIGNFDIPSVPISIMAGIYGGYGFAFASIKNDISALGQTANFTRPFNGGGFMGEVIAAVNLKLSPALSLNINGGYRMAIIPQMVQSADVSYDDIPGVSVPVGAKGDVLKDYDNNVLAFDYSGVNIGVGISLGF